MAKTIYQQLKDGVSVQSIRDTFWSKITKTATEMHNEVGVDLLTAGVVAQMKQNLEDEITRAESRLNKEDNKALENKRKELLNACLEYLAAVTHDSNMLELKDDAEALEMFYPMLASIEKNFISTWRAERNKSEDKEKKPKNPDELIAEWITLI